VSETDTDIPHGAAIGRVCRRELWSAIKTEDGQWEAQPPTRANTFVSDIPLRVIKTSLSEEGDWMAIGFSGTDGYADRVYNPHEQTAIAFLLEMWSERDADPSVIRPGDRVEVMSATGIWKAACVLSMRRDGGADVRLVFEELRGSVGPGHIRHAPNYSRKSDGT
jgi:hypothetical protein